MPDDVAAACCGFGPGIIMQADEHRIIVNGGAIMRRLLRTLYCSTSLLVISAPACMAESGYKLVKTIDLPGEKGGHGDWVAFDEATGTVWLSQSPDHDVVVLDTTTNTVKGIVPGIEDGNGLALSPDFGFLSDNESNVTIVVDKQSLKRIATLQAEGKEPNGVVYLPQTGNVYVSTDGGDMTVFAGNPPFGKIAHIQLQPYPPKDGPDVALYVPSQVRLYQPIDNVVDVTDPQTNKVLDVWKLGIKGSGKPMVYDSKSGHFIMGTTDLMMLVLDGKDGSVIDRIPVKGKVDMTVIDEGDRRAYVGDKSGIIEVIDLDTDKIIDILASEKNVHSLTVDTKTHDVYVYRNESNKVDVFSPSRSSP